MTTQHTIPIRRGLAVLIALASLLLAATPVAAAAPGNDNIANPTPITALPFSDAISTVDATTEDGSDPSCAGNGHTVWYAITLAADTRVKANTFGSSYDTTLSAYTGTAGALNQIACNDDAGFGVQSSIAFEAAAGVTYWLMVGSCCGNDGGDLTLSVDVAPPPLEIDLQSVSGRVVPKTGMVMLSGTVLCSRHAVVNISSDLQQRSGRATISGYGSTQVECDGRANWSIIIFNQNGRFAGGQATFYAFASSFDEEVGIFVQDAASGRVNLQGSR